MSQHDCFKILKKFFIVFLNFSYIKSNNINDIQNNKQEQQLPLLFANISAQLQRHLTNVPHLKCFLFFILKILVLLIYPEEIN